MMHDQPTAGLSLELNMPEELSVKAIGLGGVGEKVVRHLVLYFASLKNSPVRLVLTDGDVFEASNASRMCYLKEGNKAASKTEEYLEYCDGSNLTLLAIEEYITAENCSRIIREDDLVILMVDNHPTRALVNSYCRTLKNVVLVSGGNDAVGETVGGKQLRGTYGNVQVYVRRDGKDLTPHLGQYHPEIANPTGHAPGEEAGCAELLDSVPQLVFTNLQVASSICSIVYLLCTGSLHSAEVSFDIADCVMSRTLLPLPKGVPEGSLFGLPGAVPVSANVNG